MKRTGTFAAIDVGTTKVCTIVGDMMHDGEMRILGVGVTPSAGMSRGMVENIHRATEAIKSSVEKAERASGTRILSAYVGIAGAHINAMNNRGVVAIPNRTRPISEDDVARAIDAARTIAIPTSRQLLHVVPRFYIVDGHDNVSDPLGMYGQRLDVETHIVTGALAPIQNLEKCVERAGVQVDELVVQPLASAEAVLEEASDAFQRVRARPAALAPCRPSRWRGPRRHSAPAAGSSRSGSRPRRRSSRPAPSSAAPGCRPSRGRPAR